MSHTPPEDTSPHAVTQGGRADHGAPGPARVKGRSGWWIAAVLVILAVLAAFWLFGRRAPTPREAGTTTVRDAVSGAAQQASPAAAPPAPSRAPATGSP